MQKWTPYINIFSKICDTKIWVLSLLFSMTKWDWCYDVAVPGEGEELLAIPEDSAMTN